jgi:dihydrofolate reductase
MGRIVVTEFISLDGVVEDPGRWTATFFDRSAAQYAKDQLFACDALIMGRKTYDVFADAWPKMEKQTGELGVRMNTMPKYAVSTTLEKPQWTNTTVISGNVVEKVRRLKEEPGQDILQFGFGPVSKLLLDSGLLDELRLWIHPIFAGVRKPDDVISFSGVKVELDLAGTKTLESGVIIATYVPKPAK